MMKVKGKHVILSFVLLVVGFLVSYSFQFTNNQINNHTTLKQWEREFGLREEYFKQEERTKELQQELIQKQQQVRKIESEIAQQEKILFNLVEDIKNLRLFGGLVKVKGPGVTISLSDAAYIKTEANANNYIVHESHIHKVVNELLASGAKAIAINGQRLLQNSYISCIGPVISVDGNEYNAPFTISAIGDSSVLYSALNLPHGVKDQLVMDNIQVRIEKKDEIIFEPYLGTTDEQI